MIDHKSMELAAAIVVSQIDSPLATGFLDLEGYVRWNRVDRLYPQLSSGEHALVDLAKHLSARHPAAHNSSFLQALAKVDRRRRQVVVNELLALLDEAELLADDGRGTP